MGEHYYYDRDGRPIDLWTFARLCDDRAYRRIGLTRITSATAPDVDFRVSTIWLGTDHSFGFTDCPVLFETMILGGTEDQNQTTYRWCTEEEARAGHAEIVATVAATVPDERITEAPGSKAADL